jgi:zinc transport system permease protein
VIGGIGLALYLQVVLKWGWVSPQMGALSFALLSAVLLGWLSKKGRERLDTAINAIWVIGMSLGIVFLAVTPTYTDPMSYLFGNILLLSREDLVVIAVLGAFVVFSVVLFYPQLQAVSFDEEFARTRGVATRFFSLFLLLLVSLTVFLMLQIVGAIMVIALLTLPAAIASVFHRRLSSLMVTSTLLVIVFSFAGLVISFLANLPTGAVTVLLLGVVYVVVVLLKKKP